jgi:polysaccharide pyruvyl transferase WcaK-like protein
VPVPAWKPRLAEAGAMIDDFAPDAVAVLGADVMDGYYNPVHTTRFLLMADLAARRGARVAILGFSFNDRPHRALRPVFDQLARSIAVNVRDALSLDRFRAFSALPATLVADAAFLLEPDEGSERVQSVRGWVDARRAAGDRVLGFNLHPMLIRSASAAQVDALVRSAATALANVAQRCSASLLLIPHDYRGRMGDAACLAPLHDALAPRLRERVMLLAGEHSAAELKAIAGLADGVVTGRMHLAIAALGMGRPVAALTYQDKFQGLFGHFDLPQRLLLAPRDAMQPAALEAMVLDFVAQLPALGPQVRERLDAVQRAAGLNLAGIGVAQDLSDADPYAAGRLRPTFAA